MIIIQIHGKTFPLIADKQDIEEIIATEQHRHIYGRYPTVYEFYGHPNWKSYHEQR